MARPRMLRVVNNSEWRRWRMALVRYSFGIYQ
jgi:hypothetical protein